MQNMTNEFGPFGEAIRSMGPMGKANPFRFSTKYQDDESDLLYYGYRYYKPSTGTWASRDRLMENRGESLYAFAANGPLGNVDYLGDLKVNITYEDDVPCDHAYAYYKYTVEHPISVKGYIVVESETYSHGSKDCSDCFPLGLSGNSHHWWEAFLVESGSEFDTEQYVFHSSDTAMFKLPDLLKPSCGYSIAIGKVKFFSSQTTGNLGNGAFADAGDLAPGWIDPMKDHSHRFTNVPYTLTKPSWWDNGALEGPAYRFTATFWSCGCACSAYSYWETIAVPK